MRAIKWATFLQINYWNNTCNETYPLKILTREDKNLKKAKSFKLEGRKKEAYEKIKKEVVAGVVLKKVRRAYRTEWKRREKNKKKVAKDKEPLLSIFCVCFQHY